MGYWGLSWLIIIFTNDITRLSFFVRRQETAFFAVSLARQKPWRMHQLPASIPKVSPWLSRTQRGSHLSTWSPGWACPKQDIHRTGHSQITGHFLRKRRDHTWCQGACPGHGSPRRTAFLLGNLLNILWRRWTPRNLEKGGGPLNWGRYWVTEIVSQFPASCLL